MALQLFQPLTREIDGNVFPPWVIRRAAVSNENKYCYFRVPKCANSTIVRSLAYYDPAIDQDEGDTTGLRTKKQFGNLLSANARNLDELQENYYCFTFVRNPYARLLSAYIDKIDEKSIYSEKYKKIADKIKNSKTKTSLFADFIDYLENNDLYENPHWIPQVAMLPVDCSRIKFIGRVETLDDDLRTVIDTIFGKGTYKETVSRNTRRQGASKKLMQYYDQDLESRVYELYRDDFEAFSYPRELPVS